MVRENLVFVKKLADKGHEVHFKGTLFRVIKNGETIAEATEHKELGLFELNISQKLLKVMKRNKLKYKAECIVPICHRTMDNGDQLAIRVLERQNKASGINIKSCHFSTLCEYCKQAEMTRKPFPKKSESKTTEILYLIHTDVCGLMETTTGGKDIS